MATTKEKLLLLKSCLSNETFVSILVTAYAGSMNRPQEAGTIQQMLGTMRKMLNDLAVQDHPKIGPGQRIPLQAFRRKFGELSQIFSQLPGQQEFNDGHNIVTAGAIAQHAQRIYDACNEILSGKNAEIKLVPFP